VVDRGYAVSEVAERLVISTKSLYTWKARLSKPTKEAKIDTGYINKPREQHRGYNNLYTPDILRAIKEGRSGTGRARFGGHTAYPQKV